MFGFYWCFLCCGHWPGEILFQGTDTISGGECSHGKPREVIREDLICHVGWIDGVHGLFVGAVNDDGKRWMSDVVTVTSDTNLERMM